jgi:hypothetical protein
MDSGQVHVARVTNTVAVPICLIAVRGQRAVVASIAQPIGIDIFLARIEAQQAVIHVETDRVKILVIQGIARARVTGIADTVAILICLVILSEWAIVPGTLAQKGWISVSVAIAVRARIRLIRQPVAIEVASCGQEQQSRTLPDLGVRAEWMADDEIA